MHRRSAVAGLVVLALLAQPGWADDSSPRTGVGPMGRPGSRPAARGAWGTLRDSKAITSSGRLLKAVARSWVLEQLGKPEWQAHFGLELDDGWQKTPVDRGLVILIHGYQSTPERHGSILKDVRAAGIPCGWLRYPNDQPIDQSADLLARELRRVATVQPERKITLLALSMGGLVARAVVEDSSLDPGNVRRLILVATPNQGSRVASYAVGADLFEFLIRSPQGSLAKRLYASIEDGLGEAAGDLRPGSEFLRALNARKRNPKVEYSLFLGTGGPVSREKLARWQNGSTAPGRDAASLTSPAEAARGVRAFLAHEADRLLADLDEVVQGQGDGCVAVERGQLEGASETVVLPFRHDQLMDGEADGSRQLRAELLKRLLSPFTPRKAK